MPDLYRRIPERTIFDGLDFFLKLPQLIGRIQLRSGLDAVQFDLRRLGHGLLLFKQFTLLIFILFDPSSSHALGVLQVCLSLRGGLLKGCQCSGSRFTLGTELL